MPNPDALLAAAERIASRLAGRGIHAALIGASALAAYRYVRHTEDIDLVVNIAIRDIGSVAEGLREAGRRGRYSARSSRTNGSSLPKPVTRVSSTSRVTRGSPQR